MDLSPSEASDPFDNVQAAFEELKTSLAHPQHAAYGLIASWPGRRVLWQSTTESAQPGPNMPSDAASQVASAITLMHRDDHSGATLEIVTSTEEHLRTTPLSRLFRGHFARAASKSASTVLVIDGVARTVPARVGGPAMVARLRAADATVVFYGQSWTTPISVCEISDFTPYISGRRLLM
jgi:hypothetical protein